LLVNRAINHLKKLEIGAVIMNLFRIGKRLFLIVTLLCLGGTSIFPEKTLDINRDEKTKRKEKLQKLNKDSFQNRTNVKADEETRKKDMEIGKKIAEKLVADPTKPTLSGGIEGTRKESNEEGKFSGDVLYLTEKANFGHINAIVRVVTGYVMESFNYKAEDSELLALYIIYYNLKHRKNIEYIEANYTQKFAVKIERDKLGIPDKFEGWQGKTQIVVPVEKNILKGGGLDLATYELEDQVNPDIDAQKDGAANKKKFANLQVKKIKEEKKASLEKFDKTQQQEKSLDDKKKKLEDELAELMKDPEANKDKIAKLKKELEGVNSELTKVSQSKKEMEEKMQQIARREEMRKMGFTSEKEFIAYQDSKKEDDVAPIVEEKKKEIVIEKPKTEEPKKVEPKIDVEIKTETVVEVVIPAPKRATKKYEISLQTDKEVIAGRESMRIPEYGIFVIGYKLPTKMVNDIRLFLVSSGDMRLVKETDTVKMHEDSPFIYHEGKLFVYVEISEKAYLSIFNMELEQEYRSSIEIEPDSTLMFEGDTVSVIKNKRTGTPSDTQKFNKRDLSPIKD
jgi:hypothetical protein